MGKYATQRLESRFVSGPKVIIRGGLRGGLCGGPAGGFIAEMEFTPIMGWPKRAYYGESGVKNDVFDASPLGGLGTEFPCF